MFQLASKYKGKIRHWQAGNEPNMAVWRERFIPFLKAYYRGVKRADPENKVVLCGFAGVEHLHLDAVYRLGGKDFFDILGAHPYTRPAMPEDGGYLERIRAIRDVMRKYGDQKPLWVDEIGWNGVEPSMLDYLRAKFDGHRNYAVTEEDQARGLVRVYLLSATVPWIERVYFFHLHQEAAYTEIADNVDYYMGLFTPWLEGQVRPKDAYFAVKTVIQVSEPVGLQGPDRDAARGCLVPPFRARRRGNDRSLEPGRRHDDDAQGCVDAQERYEHGGHSATGEKPPDSLRTTSLPAK